MGKNKQKKQIFFKMIITCLLVSFFLGGFFAPQKGQASGIPVIDTFNRAGTAMEFIKGLLWDMEVAFKDWYQIAKERYGAQIFANIFRNALQKIAYDTATWLGSGGKGEKPMFITEGWGEYLGNIGDEAAGEFLEAVSKGENFNFCEPDLNIKIKIGLGLAEQVRPKASDCTFKNVLKNWEDAIQNDKKFFSNMQNYFDTGGDLGLAIDISAEQNKIVNKKFESAWLEAMASHGWNAATEPISGKKTSPPGYAEMQFENSVQGAQKGWQMDFGEPFVNAANVFVSQYFYTLFTRKLGEIGKDKPSTSNPYPGNPSDLFTGLTDPNAGSGGGASQVKENLNELLMPNFETSADFDVLAKLTICPNQANAGPTDCVITDNFSKAALERLTVGEAMKKSYLMESGRFGFKVENTPDGFQCFDEEPSYHEGYPYRTMLILRKYRILPVGWELAAQYINSFPAATGSCNLGDMVACYNSTDEYEYQSDLCNQGLWCQGLVDPNWVISAPTHICRREGAGANIRFSQNTTGVNEKDVKQIVTREEYCADEQSCLYKNREGICEQYGYCLQEKRKWDFNNSSCEPLYNTCETYRKREGESFSFLENTIDNASCDAENVGCQAYCEDYNYNNGANGYFECDAIGGNRLYLDADAKTCDSENEGCREFIRIKSGLGTNLVQNSSFEESFIGDQLVITGTTQDLRNWSVYSAAGNPTRVEIQGAATGRVHSGENSTLIESASGGLYSTDFFNPPTESVFPDGFVMEAGQAYTLSAWVYVETGEARIAIGNSSRGVVSAVSTVTNNWERLQVTLSDATILSAGVSNEIYIFGNAAGTRLYVDDVQLEIGNTATEYKEYRNANVVYEKLLPSYLSGECYRITGTDYRYQPGYPAVCDQYIRLCNKGEVGCDLYTSLTDGFNIPAKVKVEDYCSEECVGYDEYLQKETNFTSLRPQYFIPKAAARCNAGSVGCEEFTNLDKISGGGETKEYYSYLRQCVKPSSATADCGEFYTWEGSGETGFQLKVHSLQIDNDGDDGAYPDSAARYSGDPAVTEYDYNECNELIYNLNLDYDCREFYNRNGGISYHLYTRTITCSEDCHPFRMTKNNVVKDPANGANISWAECQALSQFADRRDIITNAEFDARRECVFCKNLGVWDPNADACIYSAVPSEGKTCAAAQVGCREYSGSDGNRTYEVFKNDFEGSVQNWFGRSGTSVSLDSDSLRVGQESLRAQNIVPANPAIISREAGNSVQKDKSYYLEFIAKGISNTTGFNDIYLTNGTNRASFYVDPSLSLTIGGDWGVFRLNLSALDHDVSATEALIIEANGGFFIDDLRLVEITDRYYIIEDSWDVPEVCYEDIYGNPVGHLLNLGCDRYRDTNKKIHNLHNFSELCQDSAIGCEALIDTANSTDYNSETFNLGDAAEEVVDADQITYAVYNRAKVCNPKGKGCQLLGKPYDYGNMVIYETGYWLNDPDAYQDILCRENEINCEEWTSREGKTYFKDPKLQTCEWRMESDASNFENPTVSDWLWLKTPVSRCDSNSDGLLTATDNICAKASDCALTNQSCSSNSNCGNAYDVCVNGECRYACLVDKNDYECTTTPNATIGTGGENSRIYVPTIDNEGHSWVGLCPASEASCAEYIDPISDFSVNLVANGSFAVENVPDLSYSTNWFCSLDGTRTCLTDMDCLSFSAGVCNNHIWKRMGRVYTQIVSLKGEQMYRLAGKNNEASSVVEIECNGIWPFDASYNNFGVPGGVLSLNLMPTPPSPYLHSTMFYLMGDDECEVSTSNIDANGVNDYIEIKKVVIDYQLEVGLNKKDCNGIVNRSEGCVLFNERLVQGKSGSTIDYSALEYDADASTQASGGPQTCSGINCDSNQIIKVKPDRTCDQWLYCKQTIRGVDKNVCAEIGVCDKFDPNGDCERFVSVYDGNLVYSSGIGGVVYPGDTANLSGYIKVGYENTRVNDDANGKFDDKYNFGSMYPDAYQLAVPNGSFEDIIENKCSDNTGAACPDARYDGVDYEGDPVNNIPASPDWGDPDLPADWVIGWTADPVSHKNRIETIDDPVENQDQHICFLPDKDGTCRLYAPDGRTYLKVSATHEGSAYITSSPIKLGSSAGERFVLSFWVNTERVDTGWARVMVRQFNAGGGVIGSGFYSNSDYRQPWTRKALEFTTDSSADYIQIQMSIENRPFGDAMFDQFELKEVLVSRADANIQNSYEFKECRLYPENDAMSCDYYEEGIRYKGWTGYCLEHDRYPGKKNVCLQWWSIPHALDGVNAYCGDQKIGDEEDCECPLNASGQVQASCILGTSSTGASRDNQYECRDCYWSGGWCGDNIVDEREVADDGPAEECDWNGNPDPSIVYGSQPNLQKLTCEQLPAAYSLGIVTTPASIASYRGLMFTGGNLGCYSGIAGPNSSGDPRHQCDFDTNLNVGGTGPLDFGCHSNLYNDAHTAQQCVALGGEVVREFLDGTTTPSGDVVIRNNQETISTSAHYGNVFCKIPVNVAGTAQQVCDSLGWQPFLTNGVPWTESAGCYAEVTCNGGVCTNNTHSHTLPSHIWSNQDSPPCVASASCGSCSRRTSVINQVVSFVGCY